MKTDSHISADRVSAWNRSRFNPIRGLTPMSLSRLLDEFDRGELRRVTALWDKIERRDDVLMSVVAKRRKAAARRDYSISALDDSTRAAAHVEALEYFFQNVRVTNAVEGNYLQGFPGLVRSMMDAVGKKWAVHEIIWRPGAAGMSAEMKFVPLWFFEHKTGELRYLTGEHATDGMPLVGGEWMVTNGEGLMEGSSVGYMFKNMALKDWVIFCEKFGLPFVWAKSQAQAGSAEYDAVHDAVQDWMNDGAMVTGGDVEVTTVSASAGTVIPMQALIERVDKRLMAIWRGGDLSTQSQGDSVGASVQDGEAELILGEDLEMIATTINLQLVPYIIEAVTGDEVPLARIDLPMADGDDVSGDLAVDKFLMEAGVPLSVGDLRERYARSEPKSGEEVIGGAVDSVDTAAGSNALDADLADEDLANELGSEDQQALIEDAVARSLDVMPQVLAPIGHVIEALMTAAELGGLTDEQFVEAAQEMALSMPEMMGSLDVGALAEIFEGAMGTAVLSAVAGNSKESTKL